MNHHARVYVRECAHGRSVRYTRKQVSTVTLHLRDSIDTRATVCFACHFVSARTASRVHARKIKTSWPSRSYSRISTDSWKPGWRVERLLELERGAVPRLGEHRYNRTTNDFRDRIRVYESLENVFFNTSCSNPCYRELGEANRYLPRFRAKWRLSVCLKARDYCNC